MKSAKESEVGFEVESEVESEEESIINDLMSYHVMSNYNML
jgi:hypothetical protein